MDTERTLKIYEIKFGGKKSIQIERKYFIYDFVFPLFLEKTLK